MMKQLMRVAMSWLAALLMVVVSASCSRAAESRAPELKEGQDYTLVSSAIAPEKSAKISVVEFFSYQCPHCFAFSQPLREWSAKLPSDVQFERESVSIGHEPWIPIARTYYTLRSMDKLASLDEKIFDAIHQQGVQLFEAPYIMGWLSKNAIAPAEFDTAYRSQAVRDAYARGEKMSMDYKIPSIPTMVIDGKYLVSIKSNVDFAQQLAIVDKLIALARTSRANQK
jgi:thiol:disulfide interchange protein DsbA